MVPTFRDFRICDLHYIVILIQVREIPTISRFWSPKKASQFFLEKFSEFFYIFFYFSENFLVIFRFFSEFVEKTALIRKKILFLSFKKLYQLQILSSRNCTKVSFLHQCSKMPIIPIKKFNIQTRFFQCLWFFRLKC